MRLLLLALFTSHLWAGPGSIAGVVRDAVTGLPVPGAQVRIMLTAHSAVTDVRGYYRIEPVLPGTYRLLLSCKGYVSIEMGPSNVVVEVKVDMEARADSLMQPISTIEGRVLTEEGAPIPAADVTSATSREVKATTGPDGSFTLTGVPGGLQALEVTIPEDFRRATLRTSGGVTKGLPATTWYPPPSQPPTAAKSVVVTVARMPLVSFSGVVIDEATGQPPPGGFVELNYSRKPLGENGAFTFDLLEPREYHVNGYRSEKAVSTDAGISLGSTGLQGYQLLLRSGMGRVEGRLSGAPNGVSVGLSKGGRNGYIRGALHEDGSFTFQNVPVGEWSLSVIQTIPFRSSPGRSCHVESSAGTRIKVEAGATVVIEAECIFDNRLIGTAVDAGGKPVYEAVLFLTDGKTRIISHAGRTDGTFEVSLRSGQYTLSAWPSAYRYRMQTLEHCGNAIRVDATKDLAGVRLVLCP